MESGSIKLTEKQVEFLMCIFYTDDPNEAIDMFLEILIEENIDPMKMSAFIDKMMELKSHVDN